jgi:YwiC-like protein
MKPQLTFAPPQPKEHGAWGMLYVPLLTAVGIAGSFNIPVLVMAAAVTLVFLPAALRATGKQPRT